MGLWARWRALGLHWQILIALVLGVAIGAAIIRLEAAGALDAETVETVGAVGSGIGKLFLSLLSMLVVPLIFSSLVTGIVGVPNMAGLRRMSLWTFGYYLMTSLIAITIGILMVNLIRPGAGLEYADLHAAAGAGGHAAPAGVEVAATEGLGAIADVLFRMVPTNVISAASDNRLILSVIFFAILFGIFIKRTAHEHADVLAKFFTAFFEVMMGITSWVVSLAPYGIFGFMIALVASGGLDIAGDLALYMLTVAVALVVHAVIVLPLLLAVLARRSPLEYARALAPALMTAFSTASSNGTLPVTMRCVDERAGVPGQVSSFTLPLGATINMDGTALYEAVAVLFISQTIADLSLAQQVIVAFTALLASIGAAGIPHAGTVMMVIVLQAVGLPTDAVIVILAVDRVLDMMRTTVNVWSDSCAAAIVARQSGEEILVNTNTSTGA